MARNEILALMERPMEPVFMPKGPNKISFDIQPQYLPDRYRPFETEIFTRFCSDSSAGSRVPVRNIVMPDMTLPLELKRENLFSIFIPRHQEMAASLMNVFLRAQDYDELLAIAASFRDRLNPHLFFYALSVALLHRPDTQHLSIPPLFEVFPGKFLTAEIFGQVKERAYVISEGSRVPFEIPTNFTATDLEPEHRLAYFREDIGINSHHWHWHLVYPFNGDINVVNKDRRGELFYFMHHQMLARYNCERLSAKLGRVKKLNNLREAIPEAYFPKLTSLVSSKSYASRPSGLTLKDVNRVREQFVANLDDMERRRDRIFFAIHKGEVVDANDQPIKLQEPQGIDILGNIVESSIISVNSGLYGSFHNNGHMAIACCHDPDYRHLEPIGVMGDNATAVRDPIFYRWHAHINDIYLEYKYSLPPYTADELGFPGIEIPSCLITTPNAPDNTLMTFWSKTNVDLSKGLDFAPQGDIPVRITHLNHANFQYQVTVENTTGSVKLGTVRVFMGPALDERELPFVLRAQLELMIEMDKFSVTLLPGTNMIARNSSDSSVTIPFNQVFRNLDVNSTLNADGIAEFNFCGCGWPQHMLVPKGRAEGFPMQLFVMITNRELDAINQPAPDGCTKAISFCGLKDRLYPDRRAMGFPFDRLPKEDVKSLSAFLTPNMCLTDMFINFRDTVIERSRATP